MLSCYRNTPRPRCKPREPGGAASAPRPRGAPKARYHGPVKPIEDVVVIGAGPAGLAVAIAAEEARLSCELVEKGVLVNSIFHFPHGMTFFTTPELLEIGGLPLVTPYEKPTRLRGAEVLPARRRHVRPEGGPGGGGRGGRARTADAFRVTTVSAGVRQRARGERGARRETSSSPPATTTTPTASASPAKTCPTSPTTTTSRTRSIGSGWWWWAARTRRPSPPWSSTGPGPRSPWCTGATPCPTRIKYWIRPDIENRIKEGSIAARFETRVVEITPEPRGGRGPRGAGRRSRRTRSSS